MFEQNYKDAMDKITPDADERDRILDKIILKEELKSRKNPAIPWRIAFACVAALAIILGVVFVPRDSFKTTSNNAPKTLQVSKSYNEIYKLIKPQDDTSLWDYIIGDTGVKKKKVIKSHVLFAQDDEAEFIIEEAVEDDEGNAETNTSGTAAPGDTSSENTNANANENESDDFSTTTEQVEGVREADIVKTDGKYIYYLIDNELRIFKADGEKSLLVSKTELKADVDEVYGDMFLKDDRLILLQPDDYTNDCNFISVYIYDISDPAKPKEIATSKQEGVYNSSRMVGDYIYLVSNSDINISEIDKDDPTTFVPVTETNGVCEAVPADSIYRYNQDEYTNQYTVIGAFNYKDGEMSDTASLLGGTENIYCSQGNIILADTTYNDNDNVEGSYSQSNTTVSRLEIKGGQIEYKATGEVEGTLENQFYIDEHNGYFRFVTTVTMVTQTEKSFDNSDEVYYIVESFGDNTSARLTVLDQNLKKTGEIKDLAKGERVYSVRFMGDIAYFVTFRQTDPLFSADLSDPKNPKILGELKIPGFSEYMYPYGDGLLLGFGRDADESTGITRDIKLSMFNITDPANVTEDDKTVIGGYAYSPALSDHKSMLVSPDKNLIGFAATDNYNSVKYLIYTYTGNGFDRVATLEIEDGYNYYAMTDVRGLFINNSFYVVSKNAFQVYDINTFLQVNSVEF
ncbi:MAG: beta-propeller domain-containing protein [Clostridia bacterium]|nr:beta-propeller domain-containing protein [Clostridia bacterium]